MVKQTYLLLREAQAQGIGDELLGFLRETYGCISTMAHVESETALGQKVRIANVDCSVVVVGIDRVGLELSVKGILNETDPSFVLRYIAERYGHEHPSEMFEGPY
mgnify:CR=1 FL=1